MNQDLTLYLLIIAGVLAMVALFGDTLLKGTAAFWVTAP